MKVAYEKSYTEKALQYTLIKNHINIYICIYTTEYWSLIECHRNFILFLYYSSAVWWLTLKKKTTTNLYRIKLLCCEFLPITSCLSSIYIFKQMFTSTSYPDHMVSVCLSVCVMKENFFYLVLLQLLLLLLHTRTICHSPSPLHNSWWTDNYTSIHSCARVWHIILNHFCLTVGLPNSTNFSRRPFSSLHYQARFPPSGIVGVPSVVPLWRQVAGRMNSAPHTSPYNVLSVIPAWVWRLACTLMACGEAEEARDQYLLAPCSWWRGVVALGGVVDLVHGHAVGLAAPLILLIM